MPTPIGLLPLPDDGEELVPAGLGELPCAVCSDCGGEVEPEPTGLLPLPDEEPEAEPEEAPMAGCWGCEGELPVLIGLLPLLDDGNDPP